MCVQSLDLISCIHIAVRESFVGKCCPDYVWETFTGTCTLQVMVWIPDWKSRRSGSKDLRKIPGQTWLTSQYCSPPRRVVITMHVTTRSAHLERPPKWARLHIYQPEICKGACYEHCSTCDRDASQPVGGECRGLLCIWLTGSTAFISCCTAMLRKVVAERLFDQLMDDFALVE